MGKKWANNAEEGKKGFQPTIPRPASPSSPMAVPPRTHIETFNSSSTRHEVPISTMYSTFTELTHSTASIPATVMKEEKVKKLRSILWQGPPNQQGDMTGNVPLVVYGTLRSGETLDDGVLDGVTSNPQTETETGTGENPPPRETAYIRGRMYKSTEGDWPLLDTKESGWVTCEVVSMDTDPETGAWNKMGTDEIAWGYSLEYVTVYDTPGEEGEPVGTALVCVWPWEQHRGEHISSGDWLTR